MRLLLAGLLAGAAIALAACGDDRVESMPTVDPSPRAEGTGFAVRPATSDLAPGTCDPDLAADAAGSLCDLDGLALDVGPAAVVGGVVRAEAVELRAGSWGLEVELDDEARQALEALTAAASSSDSRIAVVVDGQVVAAPTVAGVVGVGTLQLVGDWSREVAEDLAERAAAS